MDKFGVQKPDLKAIAKQPKIPNLKIQSEKEKEVKTKQWLGATIKNIETIEEQSSFGTHSLDGVIIVKINKKSKLIKSSLREGDVIVGFANMKVKNISNFLNIFDKNTSKGSNKVVIIRDQKEINIKLSSDFL
jgi:S1-C subfamily serine protease